MSAGRAKAGSGASAGRRVSEAAAARTRVPAKKAAAGAAKTAKGLNARAKVRSSAGDPGEASATTNAEPRPVAKPSKLSVDLRGLEKKLEHRFARPELLELAMTHRSHTYEAKHGVPAVILPAHPEQRDQRNAPGTDNEQMEFLGDAVIGMVVTEALFREFPQCSEGDLTRLRSNLVSRKRMAEMGLALGLDEGLRLGKGAEQNGGRSKPALLANCAEAVVAAVYLDARSTGTDGLAAIQVLAERYLVQPELAAMKAAVAAEAGRALRDHKTLLQEKVQAAGVGRLRYVDIAESGPPHLKRFTVEAQLEQLGEVKVLGQAEGGSKKEAQQRAAEVALAGWVPA
jgi:ribonuclease-3